MKQNLLEYQMVSSMKTELLEETDFTGQKKKHLYMNGICIQGDVRNQNQRIYPFGEIQRAVTEINDQITNGHPVLGELSHPDSLQIAPERASHAITKMWMEQSDGYGKLKILSTPMGNIVRAILEDGVPLGVSSRGSGSVNESTGMVSEFFITTVDVVATPSAPNAYPVPVYESLLNSKGGYKAYNTAIDAQYDPKVQKYIKESLVNVIRDLKKL
jgi:hypothetical protein